MIPSSFNLTFKCLCGNQQTFQNIAGQLVFTCLCGRTFQFNLPGMWIERKLKQQTAAKPIPVEE